MSALPKKEYSENFKILKGLYDQAFKKYWGENESRQAKFPPIPKELFEKRILECEEFAQEWGEFDPLTGALNPKIDKKTTYPSTKPLPMMSQHNSLPTQSITLFFRSSLTQTYEVSSWNTADTSLVVKAQEAPFQGVFIQVTHDQLNTQLDLGGVAPAVVLQFDEQQVFTGASLSLGTAAGSFGLVTQSKRLLILPFDAEFPIAQLTHFEIN